MYVCNNKVYTLVQIYNNKMYTYIINLYKFYHCIQLSAIANLLIAGIKIDVETVIDKNTFQHISQLRYTINKFHEVSVQILTRVALCIFICQSFFFFCKISKFSGKSRV